MDLNFVSSVLIENMGEVAECERLGYLKVDKHKKTYIHQKYRASIIYF